MIAEIAIFQRPHSTISSCFGILVPVKIASPCHRGGKEEYLGSIGHARLFIWKLECRWSCRFDILFKGEESSGEILIIGEEGLDFPALVFDAVSEDRFSLGASSTCSRHGTLLMTLSSVRAKSWLQHVMMFGLILVCYVVVAMSFWLVELICGQPISFGQHRSYLQ